MESVPEVTASAAPVTTRYFNKTDFPANVVGPGIDSNINQHGLVFTSVEKGAFYDQIAAQVIEADYADVTLLTYIFNVVMSTDDEGGVNYNMSPPNPMNLRLAYNALRNNTHISIIRLNHFKHIGDSLDPLLSALAENLRLPLKELTLRSIIQKKPHGHEQVQLDQILSSILFYMPKILAGHKWLTHLSLASNRLGTFAHNKHLTALGEAISGSKHLQVLDLSNNKFTFAQAMVLLAAMTNNTSLSSLKIDCRKLTRKEKNQIKLVVSSFLQKNQDIRAELHSALDNADLTAVKILTESKGADPVYAENYLKTKIAELETVISKQRGLLSWFPRIKTEKRNAAIATANEKIEQLRPIQAYLWGLERSHQDFSNSNISNEPSK